MHDRLHRPLSTVRAGTSVVLRRIRAGREPGVAPDFPIVVLTPRDQPGSNGTPEGASDRVAKPVTRRELLAAVERALPARPRPALLKSHFD